MTPDRGQDKDRELRRCGISTILYLYIMYLEVHVVLGIPSS